MVPKGVKPIATNRQARRDYDLLDTVEAGISLRGSEVKSLREAKVTLADAHARVIDGEMWLIGLHVAPYSHTSTHEPPEPDRDRKLLLHRAEIDRLAARVAEQRLTLVPLALYFKDGRAKLELALAKGLTHHDRRQEIAKRDADREAARAIADARRK